MNKNIEIKARCDNQEGIRKILKSKKAKYEGTDYQIDTYFKVANGRLKLREGNIENALIHYNRNNTKGPKQCEYTLYASNNPAKLKKTLTDSLGILVVVEKKREIYLIDNIKFHIDIVKGLGTFVEIEATDRDGCIEENKRKEQCEYFIDLFQIAERDLVADSYSDLLLLNNI